MPLDHYGVLIGTLASHQRDQPDTQGRWFHVNLQVTAPLGSYRCAVDVDSKQSATGVQWKVLTLSAATVAAVAGLPAGYHELAHSQAAGAMDLIRHPAFRTPLGCVFVMRPPEWLQRWIDALNARNSWQSGSNLEASTALESTLTIGRRVLIFGEPFTTGLGMHNIHQNQGDPPGSQWFSENGIWQDGAVFTERTDGSFETFVSKFSSQASRTDNGGHPI